MRCLLACCVLAWGWSAAAWAGALTIGHLRIGGAEAANVHSDASALVDQQWKLTEPGRRFDALQGQWTTSLDLTVGPDGAAGFTGCQGDYELTIDGRRHTFALVKGVSQYDLDVGVAP